MVRNQFFILSRFVPLFVSLCVGILSIIVRNSVINVSHFVSESVPYCSEIISKVTS